MATEVYANISPPDQLLTNKGTILNSNQINTGISNDTGTIYRTGTNIDNNFNVVQLNGDRTTANVNTPAHESNPNYKTNMNDPNSIIKQNMVQLDPTVANNSNLLKRKIQDLDPTLQDAKRFKDFVNSSKVDIPQAIQGTVSLTGGIAGIRSYQAVSQLGFKTIDSGLSSVTQASSEVANAMGSAGLEPVANTIRQTTSAFISPMQNIAKRGLSGDMISPELEEKLSSEDNLINSDSLFDVAELGSTEAGVGTVATEVAAAGAEVGSVALGAEVVAGVAVGAEAAGLLVLAAPVVGAAVAVGAIGYGIYEIGKSIHIGGKNLWQNLGI
jgi:hypothetical protein